MTAERGRDRQRTAIDCVPAPFRDRTPPGWRERLLARVSGDVVAGFGFEFRCDELAVTPGGRRRDAIEALPLGHHEIDGAETGGQAATALTCVSDPRLSHAAVQASVDEFLMSLDAITDRLHAGRAEMPVHEVMPGADPHHAHRRVEARSFVPEGHLRPVFGVVDGLLGDLLHHLRDRQTRTTTLALAGQIERRLEQHCDGLPPGRKLRHFILALAYFITEARRPRAEPKTWLPALFELLNQSDFHADYLKNLGPDDRLMARALLLKPSPDEPSLLTQIMQVHGSSHVFGAPHPRWNDAASTVTGPTYDQWGRSIVWSRGPGLDTAITVHGKDAASPPDGYPAHVVGKRSVVDMGALGVDPAVGARIFKVQSRGGLDTVLANSHLKTAVKLEQRLACRLNPVGLTSMQHDLSITKHEVAWMDASAPAIRELGRLRDRMVALIELGDVAGAHAALAASHDFDGLQHFRATFREHRWSRYYPLVAQRLNTFVRGRRAELAHRPEAFHANLAVRELEDLVVAMWRVDATTTTR